MLSSRKILQNNTIPSKNNLHKVPTSAPISVTELLKNPKKIQHEVAKGAIFYVFSRSKWIFTISPPESDMPSDNPKKPPALPQFSVGVKKTIHRKDIYSQNSWLDE